MLLVSMSWVSFWLEPSAIPGRTTLGRRKCLLRSGTVVTGTRDRQLVDLHQSPQEYQRQGVQSGLHQMDRHLVPGQHHLHIPLSGGVCHRQLHPERQLPGQQESSEVPPRPGVSQQAGRQPQVIQLMVLSSLPPYRLSSEYQEQETSSMHGELRDKTERFSQLFNFSPGNRSEKKHRNEKRTKKKEEIERDHEIAVWIDKLARIFFPLSWILFMFLYFFYLAEVHKETQPINIPLEN